MFNFDVDLEVVFWLVLVPSWAPLGEPFGPWAGLGSLQLGPKIVFEGSYLRKSGSSQNNMFYNTFGGFWPPHETPECDKVVPRRVLGPLGSLLFAS